MNTTKHKILLLSGEFGDGHKQAANALVEATGQYAPEIETVTIDFMELVYPKLHRAAKYLYIQGISRFPSIYGYLFQKTRRQPSMKMLKKLRLLGLGKLLTLLQAERPDAVICTFPVAAAAVSLLKAGGLTHVPLITVITDHTDHAYWIHPYTDLYIVGSEKVKHSLLKLQIPERRIAATGIPIRLAFERQYDSLALRRQYGLSPNKRTIMVMGGGYGMIGPELIRCIKAYEACGDLQWIIVCGRNEKLYTMLEAELSEGFHHVRLYQFTERVHELMAISDLLITKPGGLTTAEALSLRLPMLLYRPLPGQEQDNSVFLVEAGAAIQAEDDADLGLKLKHLLDSPNVLEAMQQKACHIRPHQPGYEALQAVMNALSPMPEELLPISAGASAPYLFYT